MRNKPSVLGGRTVDEVVEVNFTQGPLRLNLSDEYRSASGDRRRRRRNAWVCQRNRMIGRASRSAPCAAFFRDKQVVVVGGGDSASEEGLFLARFATRAVIHRRRTTPVNAQAAGDEQREDELVWDTVVGRLSAA
jgi:hypothetical protein